MQVVYRARDLIDAHLARHVLEGADIPVFVLGENLLGGAGELPLFGLLQVCVPDPWVPQANAVLQAAGLGEAESPHTSAPDAQPGLLPT